LSLIHSLKYKILKLTSYNFEILLLSGFCIGIVSFKVIYFC